MSLDLEVDFKASYDEIIEYFKSLDTNFLNRLSTEVNLEDYLKKIHTKSDQIILRRNNRIVAAMFFYSSVEGVYVTHVSVSKSFERRGCGKKMFELLKDREKHQPISLEVDLANQNAINFYETIGFRVKNTSESKLVMELLWK
jgi:ribosomal protein S18 acetylase RimI-like enzyme